MGGFGDTGDGTLSSLNSVEVLDGTSWVTASASLTTPRTDVELASHAGLLYAVGGYDGSNQYSSVEVFDGTSWTLRQLWALPTGRYNFGLASYNGLLYAVGGKGSDGGKSTRVFNGTSNGTSWSPGPDLTTSRTFLGLACS